MWWLLGIAATVWLIWKVRSIYRRAKAKEAAATVAAAIPRPTRRIAPLEEEPSWQTPRAYFDLRVLEYPA